MNRSIFFALFALLTGSAVFAELKPPTRTPQAVADPAMIVEDRGAKLEVYPTMRATPHLDASGRIIRHQVTRESVTTPISPHHLGVVFNHALQQQGYISGEIVFQVRDGQPFAGSPALYPGLKRITKPSVYVVNARTPGEFIKLLKRLQARSDLAWVEPTVTYGAPDDVPAVH